MALSIIFAAGLLWASSFAFRALLGSWLTPPAFCAVYWTLFVSINLFFPEYPLLPQGLFYILAVLWVFALSHYLVTRVLGLKQGVERTARHPLALTSALFYGGLAVSIGLGLAYIAVLRSQGTREIVHVAWLTQLLLINHFSGPIITGILLGAGLLRGVQKWAAPLALLPALFISIIYTGRTALIGPLIIMITSYLAGTVISSPNSAPLFSMRRIVLAAAAFAGLGAYATGIYVLRMVRGQGEGVGIGSLATALHSYDSSAWKSSYNSIRTSIFGQPSAFTYVFERHYHQASFSPYWGKFMFAGPLVLLGHDRPAHQNYVGLDGVETNVYTIFAPPLEDFGPTGALIWWTLLGAASAAAYRSARSGSLVGATGVAIILINEQICAGFLFRYNSVIGAYFFAGFTAWCFDRWRRKKTAASDRVERSLPAA